MKKIHLFLLAMLCSFSACEEIYDPESEEYSYNDGVETGNVIAERYESIWFTIRSYEVEAHVPADLIGKNISLMVSTSPTAEGGICVPLDQEDFYIGNLQPSTLYYYCAYVDKLKMKGEVGSFVTESFLSLRMEVVEENDRAVCRILTDIPSENIIEKGFCYRKKSNNSEVFNPLWKKTITGNDFSLPLSESVDGMEAYALTADGISYSYTIIYGLDIPVTFEPFERVCREGKLWLKFGVKGCVDNCMLYTKRANATDFSATYLPEMVIEGNGMYGYIDLASYGQFDEIMAKYKNGEETSPVYTFNHAIETEEEFYCFVQSYDKSYWYKDGVTSLETDINIPSNVCLQIPIRSDCTLEGNNHVIDGFCYYPLFGRGNAGGKVRNLRIGTPQSTFVVKKGTEATNPLSGYVPNNFLKYDFYNEEEFENCIVEGTILVYDTAELYMAGSHPVLSGVDNRATIQYVKP